MSTFVNQDLAHEKAVDAGFPTGSFLGRIPSTEED